MTVQLASYSITRKIGASMVDGFENFNNGIIDALDKLEDQSIDDWSPLVLWLDNTRIAEANKGRLTWVKRGFERPASQSRPTLRDWVAKSGIEVHHHPTAGEFVVIDQCDPNRAGLYNLADYIVSSANGITLWLSPRR